MTFTLKLGEKGTIHIPDEALKRLGWSEKTEVELAWSDQKLIIREAGHVARDPDSGKTFEEMTPDEREAGFRRWLGKYAGTATSGLSSDEIMHMTRGDK